MSDSVFVGGAAMTAFQKPGASPTYDVMGADAVIRALGDAGLTYNDVDEAFVGFVFGDSGSAQQTLYRCGVTGIPITNLSNACASGASAIYLASLAIRSGKADCVLALGFDQMVAGSLGLSGYDDRPPVVEKHLAMLADSGQEPAFSPVIQFFSLAAEEYRAQRGIDRTLFSEVAVKSRRHAVHNPYALFREEITCEQVEHSRHVYGKFNLLHCCPPTSGAAAVLLVSEKFAKSYGIARNVELAGVSQRSDGASSFNEGSFVKAVGYDMVRDGAAEAYEEAGVDPSDVDVAEVNDNFASTELINYEALQLCAPGDVEKYVLGAGNTYGGETVVNPSGGMLSRGHPLGATGVAQCVELTWQLRGQAGARQVPDAKVALQQVQGFVSAGVVAVYKAHRQ